MDILHPVGVDLGEALRLKADAAVADDLERRLGERLHLDKPLIGGNRLDRRAAAVAGADIVRVWFDLEEVALGFEVGDECLPRFVAIHALVFAAPVVDGGVVVHDLDLFQAVALPDEEVVRVVRGRDLHAARAEADLDIVVGDDRNLSADNRQNQRLADKVGVALIVRVDGDGGVAEHRLGAGGGNLDILVAALDRVLDVPEMACLFAVLDLRVGEGGCAVRAPVDDAVAAVNQPFFIEVDEDLLDRAGTALVHREALARPVAGGAQLL